jgi:hypothetical protein
MKIHRLVLPPPLPPAVPPKTARPANWMELMALEESMRPTALRRSQKIKRTIISEDPQSSEDSNNNEPTSHPPGDFVDVIA